MYSAGDLYSDSSAMRGGFNDLNDMFGFGAARRERMYNEYLSNTAYQRAVADMKEAGLNPAMMYAGGSNMQASSGAHSAATAPGVGLIGQIASVVNSAANMVMVSDNRYHKKDDSKIVSSAAKMIQTAQLMAKLMA